MLRTLKIGLVTVVFALLYSMILMTVIGVRLIIFEVRLDPERWGFKIPIALFLLLLAPGYWYAQKYVAALDRESDLK